MSRRIGNEPGDRLRPRPDGAAQPRAIAVALAALAAARAGAGCRSRRARGRRRSALPTSSNGWRRRWSTSRPPRRCAGARGRAPEFPFPRTAARLAVRGLLPRVLRSRRGRRTRPRSGSRRSARASWSTPTGYVVTNNHVIAEADEISVVFGDDTDLQGRADRPRQQDRPRPAQDRGPTSRFRRSPSATATASGSATGSSRSAIRSASAAR